MKKKTNIKRENPTKTSDIKKSPLDANTKERIHLYLPQYLLNLSSPVFLKNAAGKYIDCNEAFAAFHKRTVAEIIGKSLFDLSSDKLADKYYQADQELIKNEKSQTYRARAKDGRGKFHDVIFQKSVFLDSDGKHAGILGIMTDVTFSRENEAELRKKSEEKIRDLSGKYSQLEDDYQQLSRSLEKQREVHNVLFNFMDSGLDWEYWLDENFNIKYMNDAAEKFTGYTAQEFISSPSLLTDIVHQEDRELWNDHQERKINDSAEHILEFRIISKEKQEHWVRHICIPVFERNGKFIGKRVTNRIITDEYETAEALRKTNRVLLDTKDMVMVLSCEFIIEFVNPAFSLVSGYAQDEVVNKSLSIIHAKESGDWNEADAKAVLEKGEQWKGEVTCCSRDGKLYYELRTISPVRNSTGLITHFVSTGKNITERKKALKILTEKEKHHRKMFNKPGVVKLLIDVASGSIVDANDEACSFYGFERRTLTLMQIGDLSLQNNNIVLNQFAEILRTEGSCITSEHKLASDEKRNVEVFLSKLTQEGREYYYLEIHDITERLKAEQENRELRLFLEAIIDNSAVLLTVLDNKGVPIIWNRAAEQMTGFKREDILHSRYSLRKLFPDKIVSQEVFGFLRRAIAGVSFDSRQFSSTTKKGKEKLFNLFPSAVVDEQGKQLATLIAGIDMTQLRIVEDELQESKLLFEVFADNFPGGLFIKDKASRIIYTNRFMEKTLGSRKWLNKKPDQYLPAEMAQQIIVAERELQNSGKSITDVLELETVDGEKRVWQVSRFHIKPDKKKSLIGGVAVDITELKKNEASLKRSEERYQMAVKAGKLAIWQVNLQTGAYSRAPNMNVILGVDETEKADKVDALMNYVHKDDRPRLLNLFDKAAKGQLKEMDFEFRMYDSSGNIRWLHSMASVYNDAEGRPHLLIGTSSDISERKLAEFALKASEKRYRKIFENANVGIAMFDLNGNFLFTNEVMQNMVDYSEPELRKLKIYDLSHKEDIEKENGLNNDIIRGKIQFYHRDKRLFKKDGTLIWCNVSVSPIANDYGAVESILSIILDITEAKERAKEIAYQARLLSSVNDAILSTDMEDKFTYWNNAAEKLYGWTAAEAMGKHSSLITSGLLPESKQLEIKAAIDAKGDWKGELLQKNRAGINIEVDSSISVLTDGKGERVGTLSINRDISQRKRVEEALRDSRQMLRYIMDNVPQAIFWKDLEYRYLGCNERFAQDIGCNAPDDIIGKDDYELPNFENADAFRLYDMEVVEKGASILNYEEWITKANRESIWIRISKLPLRNAAGKVVALLGVYEDITARKEAEEKLHQYTEELKELNANKDKFFSIIAHDLRSPFNSMLALAQLISEEYDDLSKEEMQNFAGKIFSSAKKMFGLLNNLLQWAKMQAGRMDFNPVNTKLLEAVEQTISIFQEAAIDKSITIETDIDDDVMVYCDRHMLDTILRNLVSNAIKFSYKNGVVHVSAEIKEAGVFVSVEDSGVGISKEIIEKIFTLEKNITSEGTSEESGTGLGLLLCKDFVEKHHGELSVKSVPGKGSVFSFNLPGAAE